MQVTFIKKLDLLGVDFSGALGPEFCLLLATAGCVDGFQLF